MEEGFMESLQSRRPSPRRFVSSYRAVEEAIDRAKRCAKAGWADLLPQTDYDGKYSAVADESEHSGSAAGK
jgi:3-deoxy-D-arabino-heptulosonate 7-phosphate (DAHP) synthase class II